MKKGVDLIYQKIINTVKKTIPEAWTKILLYGEIGEGFGKADFYYYPENKEQPIYNHDIPELFDIPEEDYLNLWDELIDNLEELWTEFQNEGQEVWTSLIMKCDNTGKFKIEYDYSDLSEANDFDRKIIREYKYLGIVSEEPRSKKY
jgi:uncharacterized protein (TIGR01741 family)